MRFGAFVAGFLIVAVWALSLPAMAAILTGDAIVFDIGKIRVRSHVSINGQEATVTRYYMKPYEGGTSRVSFRTEDRATYLLSCHDQRVGLLKFVVLKPKAQVVYERTQPEYKPAHGPEMIAAFKRVCQVELSDKRPMHPDFWFGAKAEAADVLQDQPRQPDAQRQNNQTSKTNSNDFGVVMIGNRQLKVATYTRQYATPITVSEQIRQASKIVQEIAFDCRKKQSVVLLARFYDNNHHLIHQRVYPLAEDDPESLWFKLPASGPVYDLFQSVCN